MFAKKTSQKFAKEIKVLSKVYLKSFWVLFLSWQPVVYVEVSSLNLIVSTKNILSNWVQIYFYFPGIFDSCCFI